MRTENVEKRSSNTERNKMKKILFLMIYLCFSALALQADDVMDESLKSDKKVRAKLEKQRDAVDKSILSYNCDSYCIEAPKVINCKLYPLVNRLRGCSLLYKKAKGLGRVNEGYELEVEQGRCADKAEESEIIGEKIMLAKPTPNTKKNICGYYLNCLRSYIDSLHSTNLIDNIPSYGSWRVKKRHLEIEAFCSRNVYTIELTRTKDIVKNGLNRGLKATSPEIVSLKEVSKRVIFINAKKGKIKNVPLNSENYSVRTGYKQAYDYKNCKVYLEALDKKEDRDINRAVVRVTSSTPNKSFNTKTRLVFEIMDVEPLIDINWHDLAHSDPTFSKKGTYVKTNTASKTLYGDPEKYAAMQMIVKKAGEAHLDSRCDIDDAKEFARGDWLHMPGYKLSYEYDMNIRPATKSEIRQAIKFLKNMKYSLKDRRLYKTVNSTKGIYELIKSEKNKKNQEKLKKKMGKEINLHTD